MALKRGNILSLIGNGRYHSCILTTFSFDFYFFEMKVMKWLRSCGVRNVNVFIDGHFYSELMQNVTGDEMKFSTGYSLYPVFENNIFHPKIWMLFGEKEGLLIVGSGNLTHSGNGNNDELWGAYHFDIKQPDHAAVFSTAWEYVSKLSATIKGLMADKTTRWIAEHAQWLQTLPKAATFKFNNLPNNEEVAFLYNSSNNSIWQQITSLVGNDKVTEVTMASPYYDLQGKAIETIKDAFATAQINIIIDENGTIPSSIKPSKKYAFYDWQTMGICRTIGLEQKSRLHAKMLHLTTQKGVEYCLLGSANITPAGLGLTRSANNEVCLLIRSKKGDLLNRLALKIKPSNKKQITAFASARGSSIYQSIIKNNSYPIKLLAAELSYNVLTIYSDGAAKDPLSLGLYDNDNRLLRKIPIEKLTPSMEIKADLLENSLKYVQLLQADGNAELSNKIIASNYFSIAKTHPNPKNEELEYLCSQLQNGELRNVLDLIHYAIIDESEKEEGATILKSTRPGAKDEKAVADPRKLYNLADYKPIDANTFNEKSILLSPSLRILDVLKVAHYQTGFLPADIRADEQEENIGTIGGNEENEVNNGKNLSRKIVEADIRKLKNFFKNLYGYFHHDILYKDEKVSDYKLTLTDLTKYLIALELIHEFGGKSECIEDEQSQVFLSYLPVTGTYDNDNVKGCCLNIIGDFLRLAKNGFKEYSFDYTRNKFEQLQRDALVSTIVCILNTAWKDDEQLYIKTLLLNTLHYLGWKSTGELNANIDPLLGQVKEKVSKLKQRTSRLDEHLYFYTHKICNAFRTTTQKREKQHFSKSATKGQVIYSSIAGVGYCYVVSVSNNEYCLARPGFDWNEKQSQFINHFGDTVYRPLPLPYLTIVDI